MSSGSSFELVKSSCGLSSRFIMFGRSTTERAARGLVWWSEVELTAGYLAGVGAYS